jgi:transcriptional regulator with XRE-family HTH domain
VKIKATKKYFIDKPLLASIGKNIREYRALKGMSIEKLAIECEVDATQIGRMELGKVNFSVSFLSKIAAALDIDPKDLLP